MPHLPVQDACPNDAAIIAAIRNGDREQYRELVSRYADKVFAVTWCRLGDRSLAEDAAQEAFITAFRRLPLLGHADKFGAWLTTIARNVAINLGIRQRGELRKRQRWALETSEASDSDAPAPRAEAAPLAESLRTAVAELPPIHRECLVLFYLENRSVAEAAQTLGISENAFKVRLHRARGVLRDTLEQRLETGLDHLRAPDRLVAGVMLALPTSPGWLAWGGLASLATKTAPFGFFLAFIQTFAALPGFALGWWMAHKENANFQEPEGFRARLHRRFFRRNLVAGVALVIAIPFISRNSGVHWFSSVVGGWALLLALDHLRRAFVIRHPLAVTTIVCLPLMAVGLLGVGLLHWPTGVLFLAQGLFFLTLGFAGSRVAPRMDYSLFARASHDLIPPTPPTPLPRALPTSPRDPLRFARFLGSNFLVEDWRRRDQTLALRLTRVRTNLPSAMLPFYWGPASWIELHRDGTVRAHLGAVDRSELAAIQPGTLVDDSELEQCVSAAVAAAWEAFDRREEPAVRRRLGEEPTEVVFRRSPTSASSSRWRAWVPRIAGILMLISGATHLWFSSSPEYQQARRLAPVAITETEIRTFLGRLDPNAPADATAWEAWNLATIMTRHLPPTNLFTPETLRAVRTNAFGSLPKSQPVPPEFILTISANPAFAHPTLAGLLSSADLASYGLNPTDLRRSVLSLTPDLRHRLGELQEFPVHAPQSTNYLALGSMDLARRVRFFAWAGCLDLIDLSSAVAPLQQCQVLPRNTLARRWPGATNRADLAGLFVPCFGELLRETCDALTILAAAHALDQIDREACIAGILRLHQGRGLFAPRRRSLGGFIRGEARDTWAAYESLRLLGALDRIPDLAAWEFRPPFPDPIRRTRNGQTVLAWEHLEAWCLREAFRSAQALDLQPTREGRSRPSDLP